MFVPPVIVFLVLVTPLATQHHQHHGRILQRLAVVFRHGDRTPDDPYPNDPYADPSNWPDGRGQLTLTGKKRMLRVGEFIRKRYSKFLSHNPLEVHARSSPVTRCLSSAALVLAGAYPPKGRLVITRSLHWQPIPIHTEPEGIEEMLISLNRVPDCPASRIAEDLQQEAPDVIDYQDKNRSFMNLISNYTGSNVTRLRDIDTIYDNLKIDLQTRKQLPAWATEEVMQHMKDMDQKIYCVNSSTIQIQRLHAGLFYNDMARVFNSGDHYPSHKKIFFYSTHDTRLTSIMRALNAYSGGGFLYGATVIYELWQVRGKHGEVERVVRVYELPDASTTKLRRIHPRLCETRQECQVGLFFQGLSNYTTDEATHRRECLTFPTESQVTGCF